MPDVFNYYTATFRVVTARRAAIEGNRVARDYGYYVLIDPPVTCEGRLPGCERIESWCATKDVAERAAEDRRYSQRMGYYGCPCGNTYQARACCGIPTPATSQPVPA